MLRFDDTERQIQAGQLVGAEDSLSRLVFYVANASMTTEVKAAAAKKLLALWKERRAGIGIQHIMAVAGYSHEPYKTEAEEILRNNL